MEVVESPLNLAHQQGRRADAFLKSHKYEEAISCHKKAADLLLVAMRVTHNLEALRSLTLQREHHLKQDALIHHKQQLSLCLKRVNKKGILAEQDKIAVVSERDTNVKFGSDNHISFIDTPMIKTLQECEHLIHTLSGASADKACIDSKEDEMANTVDENKLFEDLKRNHAILKSHTVDMLKDIENLQRQVLHFKNENDHLRENMNRVEKAFMEDSTDSEKYYPVPVGMNLHDLPTLELPPLEIPKFDFSALKINSEDTDEQDT